MWSYNTHPQMFPLAQDLARFSDVVGASHSKYFSVYKYNSEASGGMKMLAEQGNTTELELEIQREVKIIIIINILQYFGQFRRYFHEKIISFLAWWNCPYCYKSDSTSKDKLDDSDQFSSE